MALILIGALIVSLLVVAGYGVHSLLQMRGATVFPLLRFWEKKEVRKTTWGFCKPFLWDSEVEQRNLGVF